MWGRVPPDGGGTAPTGWRSARREIQARHTRLTRKGNEADAGRACRFLDERNPHHAGESHGSPYADTRQVTSRAQYNTAWRRQPVLDHVVRADTTPFACAWRSALAASCARRGSVSPNVRLNVRNTKARYRLRPWRCAVWPSLASDTKAGSNRRRRLALADSHNASEPWRTRRVAARRAWIGPRQAGRGVAAARLEVRGVGTIGLEPAAGRLRDRVPQTIVAAFGQRAAQGDARARPNTECCAARRGSGTWL